VATDQEGGQVQVLSGPGFSAIPSAAVQGGWSPSQLQNAATGWGQQLRAAGINVDLAPVNAVLSPALGTANAQLAGLTARTAPIRRPWLSTLSPSSVA